MTAIFMIDARAINAASPVNWRHPLNVGRQAWWIVMPGVMGGGVWRDITNRRNNGTLTSMGNANNGWRGTSRPGGWGSMLLDGTAGYIGYPAGTVAQAGTMSAAAWFNCTNVTGSERSVLVSATGAANTQRNFLLDITSIARFGIYAGNTQYLCQSGSVVSGAWYRIVGTYDGITVRVYLNGSLTASTAGPGTPLNSSAASPTIGRFGPSSSLFFPGYVDDVSTWSRALSASEVSQDYLLSALSYPGVLNRQPLVMMRGATASRMIPRPLFSRVA